MRVLHPPVVTLTQDWILLPSKVLPSVTTVDCTPRQVAARLDCQVTAVPPATVTWTGPAGPPLAGRTSSQADMHSLEVDIARDEDYGNYTCQAENSVGRGRKCVLQCIALNRTLERQTAEVSARPHPALVAGRGTGRPGQFILSWRVVSVLPVLECRILYR